MAFLIDSGAQSAPFYPNAAAPPSQLFAQTREASVTLKGRPGRPALGLADRGRRRIGKALLFARAQKTADRQLAAARHQKKPLDAELLMGVAGGPAPERIEGPFGDPGALAPLAGARRA